MSGTTKWQCDPLNGRACEWPTCGTNCYRRRDLSACGRPEAVGDHDPVFGSCEAVPEPHEPVTVALLAAVNNAVAEHAKEYDRAEAAEERNVALLKALKALRDWHKDEYQSNPSIDAQADEAITLAESAPVSPVPEKFGTPETPTAAQPPPKGVI